MAAAIRIFGYGCINKNESTELIPRGGPEIRTGSGSKDAATWGGGGCPGKGKREHTRNQKRPNHSSCEGVTAQLSDVHSRNPFRPKQGHRCIFSGESMRAIVPPCTFNINIPQWKRKNKSLVCGETVIQQRYPGHTPLYCSQFCKDERVARHGEKKKAAGQQAGLTWPINNGMVEGHVTKPKLIKRTMYGKAGFALLRQRVLHAL
jgi:hypothetical protein